MNINDRIALEIGRAVLRAIAAEARRDEVIAALAAASDTETDTDEHASPA